MNMSLLESLIYGLISGFTEFLPVSSQAHQNLLIQLYGIDTPDPIRDLITHLSIFLALFSGCRVMLEHLRRERKLQLHKRRSYGSSPRILLDTRLVKNAAIPMLIGLLILSYVVNSNSSILFTAIFLLINGIILYMPSRMMQGNKDARSMTAFDSIFIGIAGALSAFAGISRVGCTTSAATARGAERQKALDWAFLLSIPALIALLGIDVLKIISHSGGISFWGSLFSYLLCAAGAYCGGYLSIMLMKFLTVRIGFSGFAYYSWGAALFTFILYLTAV